MAAVAAQSSMPSRSPARFKPAGATTTTTSTTAHKTSRMLQRSNDEQKHGNNTEDMVTRASLEDDIRRMTENFEDEVRLHRAALVKSMNTARTELVRRLESITPTLIDSLADMTVNQFVGEYSCNLLAALKADRLGTVEQAQDEINRTIKKRKRIATAGTESANNTAATDEDGLNTGSPMKSRKNMRMAPPTPKMLGSQGSTFPRSASRPGMLASNAMSRVQEQQPQHGSAPTQMTRKTGASAASSRLSIVTSKQRASTSNAGNFIYKARPSMTVPTNFNGPRLPQTPKAFGASATASLGTARTAGKSTAKRLPRKHEAIQAYSMNGSPLGLFDLAVEQAQAQSSDSASQAPSSQSGVEEDWEVLSNKTAGSVAAPAASTSALPSLARQPSNTPFGKMSPSKLGRKPSHSAFKDKILAGASKAFGGGSHMQNRFASPSKQHNNNNATPSAGYSLARPPTREEFTFSSAHPLPSIPSQRDMQDRLEAMRADLARMCPDPEQRKLFEQTYLEVMRSSQS